MDNLNDNKDNKKWILKYISLYSLGTALLLFLAILWQGKFTPLTMNVALYIVGAIYLVAGWLMFINNRNFFSSISYGFRSMGSWIQGKKREEEYFDYIKNKVPASKRVIISTFVVSAILLSIAIITHIIFL